MQKSQYEAIRIFIPKPQIKQTTRKKARPMGGQRKNVALLFISSYSTISACISEL